MSNIYLLNNQKYKDIKNIEIFKIEYIASETTFNEYDFLIITSKNAIYSLNSFNKEWKDVPCMAIAPKTASIIKEEGGMVFYTGSSGHGNDFANEILPHLKNKKVIYIRAKEVVSNLVKILKENKIVVDELITYKTVCNKDIDVDIQKGATIIFTSPSSVKCFFKKYSWDKSYRAIVIGKTTSKYLPKEIPFQISSKTSIEECIKLAKMVSS